MAEMNHSTTFSKKSMNQSNKGHSDLDSDKTCPECGCSFGNHKDLVSRIEQLNLKDRKREDEMKKLVNAVQHLSSQLDNFVTNMKSFQDLPSDCKIGGEEHINSNNKFQDSANHNAEVKGLVNVRNADSQIILHTVITPDSEDVQNLIPRTENVSNSSSIPSVISETEEHSISKNVLDFKSSSLGHTLNDEVGLSQTELSTSTSLSTSIIEPNLKDLVNFPNAQNCSKGNSTEITMQSPTETTESSNTNYTVAQSTVTTESSSTNNTVAQSTVTTESNSTNNTVAQSTDNSAKMVSQILDQNMHDPDESQETSQEVRSPIVVSHVPAKIQKPNFQKEVSKFQVSSSTVDKSSVVKISENSRKQKIGEKTSVSQPAAFNSESETSLDPKHGQKTLVSQSAALNPNSNEYGYLCAKTVLCIDISASMETNNAWEQLSHLFREFMTEAKRQNKHEEQAFAIVTFGIQTQIIQTMTLDLSMLDQKFQTLKLGGPSPLYGGLCKALLAAQPVTPVPVAGRVIYPRIILISDGHATDPSLSQGPDDVDEEKMQIITESTCKIAMKLAQRKVRVDCVPVGNANLTLMKTIASITHGRIYSFRDGALLAKFTQHNEVILDPAKDEFAQHHYNPKAGVYGNVDVSNTVLGTDEELYEERVNAEKSLPKLGCRVYRGPDWNRGNEDGNGVGTVVGHPKNFWVNVVWDHSKTIHRYKYGAQGNFDVVIIEDPRVLKFNEDIAVGCHVQRGKNWFYGNVDGGPGSTGVVLKVQENRRVLVRWENKRQMYFDFGNEGNYELEVCNPFDDIHYVQQLREATAPPVRATAPPVGATTPPERATAPPERATIPYPRSVFNPIKKNNINKNKNKNKK